MITTSHIKITFTSEYTNVTHYIMLKDYFSLIAEENITLAALKG